MNSSADLKDLFLALSQAQSKLEPAIKNASNPFFKSKYADLASIWESARKPLSENGLSIIQTTHITENGSVLLLTTLAHKSGQWVQSEYPINPVKPDPQSLGSALTFGRRYSMATLIGATVAEEDDDAERAMNRQPNLNYTSTIPQMKDKGQSLPPTQAILPGIKEVPSTASPTANILGKELT